MSQISLIFLVIFTLLHLSSTKEFFENSEGYTMEKKLAKQEKLLNNVISRLYDIERKNQQLEIKNQELEKKLKSQMEDINDDLQKHITSSEIHFNVIEQNVEDHIASSSNKFSEIQNRLEEHDAKFVKAEEIFVGHLNESASNFAQVQISIADQMASSDR